MADQDKVKVLSVELMKEGLLVEFGDGRQVIFSDVFLRSVIDQGEPVQAEPEGDGSLV